MLRRRRTLSVYAASAPVGSVFFASSSTAHCARATAWATVRLQDRVWEDMFEGMRSGVRITGGRGSQTTDGRVVWGAERGVRTKTRGEEKGEERERERERLTMREKRKFVGLNFKVRGVRH